MKKLLYLCRMSFEFLFLAIPASLALVLLIIHSVVIRGKRTTASFFLSLIAFGFLRGNLVHIITRGRTPYEFGFAAVRLGHTGIVEAMGWCISLYISWSVAQRLLARRSPHENNVFAVLLFSCAVMTGFGILMETAAGRLGWWHWKPPKGMILSPAFRDIEKGIAPWFSVAFDFLMPYLLFTQLKITRWRIALLGLMAFPFHFGMHEIRRFHLDEHMIKVNHLSHFIMIALAMFLPFFAHLELKVIPDYPKISESKQRFLSRLDIVGLFIVIATVCLGLIFVAEQWELTVFALPLLCVGVYALWWSEKGCLSKSTATEASSG